jgi:hypothetical protein
MTEKEKNAPQLKYMKKTIRRFTVDLNRNTEPELLEYLEKQPNVAKFIKQLIRADMDAHNDK